MNSAHQHDEGLRRVVWLVAVFNLAYFGVEFSVALAIGSVSLFADSIDFLEDAAVNFFIVRGLRWNVVQRSWPLLFFGLPAHNVFEIWDYHSAH